MQIKSFVQAVLLGVLIFSGLAQAASKDVKGSADHPQIGRFAGSWIAGYERGDFDEHLYIYGKVDKPGQNSKRIEGQKTSLVYHVPKEVAVLEIFRNFENKLRSAGFAVEYQCAGRNDCGTGFKKSFPIRPVPVRWGGEELHYLAAKKAVADGETHVTVYCETLGGSGKRGCQVNVVEPKPLQAKMIDAEKMARGIAEAGQIALYGIYFDTNKADIKSESKPTLDEIAKLMKKLPALKIVVVGHTDNQGSFDHNMDLSKRRAKAVVDALVRQYGVDARRLRHWGVGFLAPVATNRNDGGRATNRRVTLVEE